MVGLDCANTVDFSSTKIQMISRVQYLPLVKQKNFLHAKYIVEGLSVRQIADLTFSSRSTVVKYLEQAGITLRNVDRHIGALPFGKRWKNQQIVASVREQAVIQKVKQLRSQGLSFEKIANVLNTMKVKTRSGKTHWYPKTVRVIVIR